MPKNTTERNESLFMAIKPGNKTPFLSASVGNGQVTL